LRTDTRDAAQSSQPHSRVGFGTSRQLIVVNGAATRPQRNVLSGKRTAGGGDCPTLPL